MRVDKVKVGCRLMAKIAFFIDVYDANEGKNYVY